MYNASLEVYRQLHLLVILDQILEKSDGKKNYGLPKEMAKLAEYGYFTDTLDMVHSYE